MMPRACRRSAVDTAPAARFVTGDLLNESSHCVLVQLLERLEAEVASTHSRFSELASVPLGDRRRTRILRGDIYGDVVLLERDTDDRPFRSGLSSILGNPVTDHFEVHARPGCLDAGGTSERGSVLHAG